MKTIKTFNDYIMLEKLTNRTVNGIDSAIQKVLKTFNTNGIVIAHGQCGDFANKLLAELGGETSETFILSTSTVDPIGFEFSYTDKSDKRYYKKFGTLPKGVTPGKLQWVDHAWVFHKGKHYDSWTTQGVSNFIDLDWFKELLEEIIEMKDETLI